MWLWEGDEFQEVDCPNTLDRVVIACGLAKTRAEAQRAIARGEIGWTVDQRGHFITLRDWAAPVFTGWPIILRRGRRFYGHRVLMIPFDFQNRFLWSRIWREERCSWWSWRVFKYLREEFKKWLTILFVA